ncbi:MAG: NAD-dependent protein deacetylase [Bacteroidetes bacterium]|nr:NAD-dependent protein deacetylase [Bacteroidota bacterium]
MPAASIRKLVDVLRGRRIVVLSGAGCSTESGIPDYRGPETRHTERNPIRYRAFVGDPAARQHYWARSAIGWPTFAAAEPNDGHRALASLEASGRIRGIITQNVDRLHHAAGSTRVVELHGALEEVVCLDCGVVEHRPAFQQRLLARNPGWTDRAVEIAPDGDAEIPRAATQTFAVPGCRRCGGVLKPNVIFFGENVPAPWVEEAWTLLGEGDALLVAGSSLTVYSGYRFVRRAAQNGHPIAIVNLGPTRGDDLATLRVDAKTGAVLPRLAHALGRRAERRGSSRAGTALS